MKNRMIILKYGLLLGVGLSFWVLGEFLLGIHTTHRDLAIYTRYASFILPISILFFALKERRNQSVDGSLSILKGIMTSLLISLFAGLIFGMFMFVYVKFLNTSFTELAAKETIESLRAQGATEEQLLTVAQNTLLLYQAPSQAMIAFFSTVIQSTLIGVFFSFVLHLFRKKIVVTEQNTTTPSTLL